MSPGKERIVGGNEDLGHSARGNKVEPLRDARQMALGRGDKLSLGATGRNPEDSVTDLPGASGFA
jgi:hypothetical protein